jgi:hypothetical protein
MSVFLIVIYFSLETFFIQKLMLVEPLTLYISC